MTDQPTEPRVSAIRDAARPRLPTGLRSSPNWPGFGSERRPTPARATRSPPPAAAFRWSRSIRRLR